MGFRTNSFATFWEEPRRISDTLTTGRISMRRQDKMTGEYKTTFSGPVGFHGTATASKALQLKNKDRIKLIDVDVEDDKVIELPDGRKVKLYRFKVWNFEKVEPLPGTDGAASQTRTVTTSNQSPDVLVDDDSELPF